MQDETNFARRCRQWLSTGVMLLAGMFSLIACSGYDLDEKDPSWLGNSIYDYLNEQGTYTNTVKIINDLGYKDVLAKTGSKTLFVADDNAFNRFFSNNTWGVKRYEDITTSMKKMLLFGSMINNSYQVNTLSSTEGPVEGNCMRRLTAATVYDTVPVIKAAEMPSNVYWSRYKERGSIVCMKDMTITPMIHFIEQQLNNNKITNDDYNFIYNNTTTRKSGDASVNGIQIEVQNIKCSNGFVHKMANVITPLSNMAEILRQKSNVSIFNHLMERFCAPYYSEDATKNYNRLYNANVDSVYQKRFFAERSQGNTLEVTPDGGPVNGQLKFDPEWNCYYAGTAMTSTTTTAIEKDMGVIMVPTNAALENYWNNGAGRVLKDYYGSWDNIPDKVVSKLINNNMLNSFTSSVPSKFSNILNDANDELDISKTDIDSVWLGCNGAIYLTNKVFSPTAYVSVSFPTLINESMSVLYWGIEQLEYNVYLNSLNSYYSFFVPTNKALLEYIDPCSFGKSTAQLFRFHYNASALNETDKVWASIWNYDTATGMVGDSIGKASYSQITNRLSDILDNHIVIGDVEDGNTYYRTKGGSELKVEKVSDGKNGMTVAGSYQNNENLPINISDIYDESAGGNGKTYILNSQPIMSSRKTVRDILSEHEEFSEFLKLMDGSGLFETIHNNANACGGTNINLFNTYHYTVYVPTNESILALEKDGTLPTWEKVELEEANEDFTTKTADSTKIVNFLKYHIQDNAIFIGAGSESGEYETSTVNPSTKRFYKLTVSVDKSGLKVTDLAGNTRNVIATSTNLYNLMAKEYQYNSKDATQASNIETSSSAVIHQIDGPLFYK